MSKIILAIQNFIKGRSTPAAKKTESEKAPEDMEYTKHCGQCGMKNSKDRKRCLGCGAKL